MRYIIFVLLFTCQVKAFSISLCFFRNACTAGQLLELIICRKLKTSSTRQERGGRCSPNLVVFPHKSSQAFGKQEANGYIWSSWKPPVSFSFTKLIFFFFRFQCRKDRNSCQRNIKHKWYSPDLLICLIWALHLLLHCSQLFRPSLCDSCYFDFISSYFDSDGMIVADGTDCCVTATSLPFQPTWRWSFVRPLMPKQGGRQALSPQQSLPVGEMLYSSLLKHWK